MLGVGVGRVVVLMAITTLAVACGDDDEGTDADSASVAFVTPVDGSSVAGGVPLDLAADGVTIEPAGEVHDGAGHFHVIADAGCVTAGEAIPRDVDHLHLGQGQTDGVLYLGPGEHELCVQVGDGAHLATALTDTVTIDVGIADQEQWCAVAEEVDARFEEVDSGGTDFPTQQAGYAGIGRLIDQMLAAMDHVDAEVRDDVRTALESAREITDAWVDAADLEEAGENLESFFASAEDIATPAAVEWFLETCGVHIDE